MAPPAAPLSTRRATSAHPSWDRPCRASAATPTTESGTARRPSTTQSDRCSSSDDLAQLRPRRLRRRRRRSTHHLRRGVDRRRLPLRIGPSMATEDDWRRGLLAYNHSAAYVAKVLDAADSYRPEPAQPASNVPGGPVALVDIPGIGLTSSSWAIQVQALLSAAGGAGVRLTAVRTGTSRSKSHSAKRIAARRSTLCTRCLPRGAVRRRHDPVPRTTSEASPSTSRTARAEAPPAIDGSRRTHRASACIR